jgi:hypothetical protein
MLIALQKLDGSDDIRSELRDWRKLFNNELHNLVLLAKYRDHIKEDGLGM